MEEKINEDMNEAPQQNNAAPEINNNGSLDSIIDSAKLCKKKSITNSELMLAMLDVCLCPKKYTRQKFSNGSKPFWENMMKDPYNKIIFEGYKPETLRKYWLIMRNCGDHAKLIKLVNVVKANSSIIDDPTLKLKNCVEAVASYIQSNDNNSLKAYFANYFHREFI